MMGFRKYAAEMKPITSSCLKLYSQTLIIPKILKGRELGIKGCSNLNLTIQKLLI